MQYSGTHILNSTCENNFSNGNGGCLSVSDGADPIMDNFLVINNSALDDGGAIYSLDNCSLSITNSQFK